MYTIPSVSNTNFFMLFSSSEVYITHLYKDVNLFLNYFANTNVDLLNDVVVK